MKSSNHWSLGWNLEVLAGAESVAEHPVTGRPLHDYMAIHELVIGINGNWFVYAWHALADCKVSLFAICTLHGVLEFGIWISLINY